MKLSKIIELLVFEQNKRGDVECFVEIANWEPFAYVKESHDMERKPYIHVHGTDDPTDERISP